jgi:peptide/nickel transport system permease protein
MLRYILRRLALLVPVLLGMSVVVFVLMAVVPGDPALAILGPYATDENLAQLRRELGLDKPLLTRYGIWLGNLLQGDFGRSVTLQRPVLNEVSERLGPTLLLSASALFVASGIGLAAGMLAAVYHRRWQDRLLTLLVLIGISTPSFWLALLLMLLFAVWLGWLPVSGMYAVYGGGGVVDLLRHLTLPALSLALVAGGVIARLTRTAALDILSQDYIRMARANGLTERQVLYRHALKNAAAQVTPVIGLEAGFILGGAVYIETVFQWPGLGRMLVDAIASRDLLLAQGGVLVLGTAYVLVNLTTDVVQRWLDPRIRL